jgi:hypothetical protein
LCKTNPILCRFCALNGDSDKKQTQFKPKQTQKQSHFPYQKPPSNPKQTQSKPNQTRSLLVKLPKIRLPRRSFSEAGPAELRNSARQKIQKENENDLTKQK